jgi:hypothetical protein
MLFFALTRSTLQADFAAVLKHGFNFSGSFACYETYDIGSVPNPCLKIDGLGVVGLPLNEREAQVIIARSSQVGHGVWEMSSDNVCPFAFLFSLSVVTILYRFILLMPRGASGFGPLWSRGCAMHLVSIGLQHLQNASCTSC